MIEPIAFFSAVLGGLITLYAFFVAGSAPQQAAAAALAVAVTIIPYCIAGVMHRSAVRKLMQEQIELERRRR